MFQRAHSLQPASHLSIQPSEVSLLSFSYLSPSSTLLQSLLLACLQAPPNTIPFGLSLLFNFHPLHAPFSHGLLHGITPSFISPSVSQHSRHFPPPFFPFSPGERRSFLPPLPFLPFPSPPRPFSSAPSRAAPAPLPGRTRALQAPLPPEYPGPSHVIVWI